METQDWTYVSDAAQLTHLCERLANAGGFGLDMEFRRDKTFFARLDLIQVATDDTLALIDPQTVTDLTSLTDLIADPLVEVIVHSGRQDMEIAYELGGRCPAGIFDTQVAAALVGFGDQVAYDRLLQKMTGHKLGKLETTSDWARRPLTDRQISYALDDVRYLPELRRKLGESLREAGREQWASEEMEKFNFSTLYVRDPRELWKTVSGTARLGSRELNVLRELAAWREDMARRRDLPRKWVLPDDVLLDIARRAPSKLEDIETISRLPAKVLAREGDAILEAVRAALATPEESWPTRDGIRDPDSVLAACDLLDLFLRMRARTSGVAASYLGTKRDVLVLARHVLGTSKEKPTLLEGWRRGVVGDDLVAIAEGSVTLRFDPDAGGIVTAGIESA